MPHPKVKISDDSGNTVDVTSNRLDVNAYLNATPTIDIGDVSLLLGGTAASTNAGTMDAQTLRVTLATDDTHWGTVGTAADVDGTAHAQLRYIANSVSSATTATEAVEADTGMILTVLNFAASTTGGQYSEGDGGFLATGVRNDTLASLVSVDHDHAPFQVNASGALYVDIADGGQLDTIIDTLETTLTAIETDQAAIEVLLTGIDSDTDAIKTAVQILDDWDDSNYANVNINLAGSDAPTGGGAESGALRVTLANDSTGVISIDDGGNTITVDGTVDLGSTDNAVLDAIAASLALLDNSIASGNELQVDVVAALPAGDNNIGNVDIVTLPASTNTIEVVGDAAEDAAAAGNPVLVGGRYDSSPREIDDGDVGAIAMTLKGYPIVSIDSSWAGSANSYGSAFHLTGDGFSQAADATLSIATVLSDTLAAPANTTDGDWCPLQVDTQGALYTTHGMTGMQSDNNEGVDDTTAEVLKSSTVCKRVDMQADPSNTGYIYVGGSDVSVTKGIRLAPGDFYSIDVNNTADIYVLASVDEEDIHFTYFT